MADEKAPRPRVDVGERDVRDPEPETEPLGAEPQPETGPAHVTGWVSRTFPGNEKAFWGGVCGLVVALAIFAFGPWRTLLVVALVVMGVAVGQLLDGKPTIVNLVRRVFSRNQ